MLAFSYIGMRNRLHLAALHFNENANRPQAMTNSGTSRYQISFPKYKKGGYIVKEVKEDCTYKYVEELIAALEEMVKEPEPVDREIPPPLCSQFQRPDKLNAVQAHKSRFARKVQETCVVTILVRKFQRIEYAASKANQISWI
ncbi:hypothetical protein ACJMK2_013577 [Sinanodonta woodiana]|uniref:Uncharacterized protein n=1 Tax=Sinanodonta woodiana TaxID=1069815 RepID=A0ABD3V0F7_SINWO